VGAAGSVADPLARLSDWLAEAEHGGEPEPVAMTLATVSADGAPSARTVALKEVDDRGLVFTSVLHGRKAQELRADPRAAIVFWWPVVRRQVTATGSVEALGRDVAERLFAQRPPEHQLQTYGSRQGMPIDDLAPLRAEVEEARRRADGGRVECPEDFGAFVLVPDVVEFWDEAPDRLHDRIEYRRAGAGWDRRRLAP
jgi:pyridoxamine 5'-phosphate oxidase